MRRTQNSFPFNKARSDIFRMLFMPGAKEIYLREMERKSSVSLRALQMELEALQKEGLVLARRDGNRLYFRGNPEHPIFPEICSITLKSFGLKNILHENLSKLKGIDYAFVFGSLAKGEATGTSDVDLMVIGDIAVQQLVRALKKPIQFIGREINPYVISKEELMQKKKQKNAFILNTLKGKKMIILGNADELKSMD